MSLSPFDDPLLLIPIAVAIGLMAIAEYVLLTRSHPLVVAPAKAVKAAVLPFALAFYVALITRQMM